MAMPMSPTHTHSVLRSLRASSAPHGFLQVFYLFIFFNIWPLGHQKLYHNNEPPGSLSSTFLWTALRNVDNLLRKPSSTLLRTCPHPHRWLLVPPFPLSRGHFKRICWKGMAHPLLYGNKIHFSLRICCVSRNC